MVVEHTPTTRASRFRRHRAMWHTIIVGMGLIGMAAMAMIGGMLLASH